MPRRKKKPQELTTEEAIKKLFPKKAIEKAREAANPNVKPSITKKDS